MKVIFCLVYVLLASSAWSANLTVDAGESFSMKKIIFAAIQIPRESGLVLERESSLRSPRELDEPELLIRSADNSICIIPKVVAHKKDYTLGQLELELNNSNKVNITCVMDVLRSRYIAQSISLSWSSD